MPKPANKLDRLRQAGILNAQPQRVRAAWFQPGGFFDANDLVQVKYEMLRHARQDGVTKAEAAGMFGLSRPTFYQAEVRSSATELRVCCRNCAGRSRRTS